MLRGLQDSINNPKEAGDAYAKSQKAQPAAAAMGEMIQMKPYVDLGPGLGQITESRAAQNIALLQSVGAIPTSFSPNELISFNLIPKSPAA
jgi:NitT/TauT family transport system substrate-binding protein